MTQSLLGYYLNHKNDIVSVTSPDGCFGDKSQGSRMAAKIVPLRFRHVGSQWLVLSQLYQIPSFLKAIFDDGVVGLTDSDATFESSHYKGVFYSVLIHTMVNEPEMNRTGLLLYRLKQDDAWMPVCVDYDSQSFMVECKGVGSADGGFLATHLRTQAGTKKTHRRITGGMLKSSMEKEFERLMQLNHHYDFSCPAVLPLGCIPFSILLDETSYDMGMVLRLTKSNIRYSYSPFGDFDVDKPPVYEQLSIENDRLFSVGYRHQNLTPNNLVYFDEQRYVVTDYQELDSIYQVPVSLDSDSSGVPLHLKIYPFRYLHSSSYTTADVGDYFSSLLAEKEVNNQFGLSKPVLMDYIKATARFTITDYKNCLLDEWVQDKLIPNLNCQLSILIEWVDVRQRYADVSFNQLLDSHRSFLFNQMEVNDWDISDFRHKVTMAMMFLVDEMAPLSVLNQRILHLKRVLRQLDYGLNAGDLFTVKQNYQTPFIAISEDIQYWDAQLLMFPFLQWVTHWHDFLQRYYRSYSQPLIQRLKHDLSHPKQLYEMFKSGPMVFIDYLVSND